MDIQDNYDFIPYGTSKKLDKKVDSPYFKTRFEVLLLNNYGLDKLIYDKDIDIRILIAWKGYGLNILAKDESPLVRISVIEQGYGLNYLINDKNLKVRKSVIEYLKKHNYKNIKEWIVKNPTKIL